MITTGKIKSGTVTTGRLENGSIDDTKDIFEKDTRGFIERVFDSVNWGLVSIDDTKDIFEKDTRGFIKRVFDSVNWGLVSIILFLWAISMFFIVVIDKAIIASKLSKQTEESKQEQRILRLEAEIKKLRRDKK
jgi:hypothetical protein